MEEVYPSIHSSVLYRCPVNAKSCSQCGNAMEMVGLVLPCGGTSLIEEAVAGDTDMAVKPEGMGGTFH